MFSNIQFIRATTAYNTFDTHIPAPYIRRSFRMEAATKATLRIAVCGFYELYFNGERITRGLLSPYISNPNDMVYYDEYTLNLAEGENLLFFRTAYRAYPCEGLHRTGETVAPCGLPRDEWLTDLLLRTEALAERVRRAEERLGALETNHTPKLFAR